MKILSHNRWHEQHFEWVENYALSILSSLSAMPHIGNIYLPAAEYENNKLYLLNINQ